MTFVRERTHLLLNEVDRCWFEEQKSNIKTGNTEVFFSLSIKNAIVYLYFVNVTQDRSETVSKLVIGDS